MIMHKSLVIFTLILFIYAFILWIHNLNIIILSVFCNKTHNLLVARKLFIGTKKDEINAFMSKLRKMQLLDGHL